MTEPLKALLALVLTKVQAHSFRLATRARSLQQQRFMQTNKKEPLAVAENGRNVQTNVLNGCFGDRLCSTYVRQSALPRYYNRANYSAQLYTTSLSHFAKQLSYVIRHSVTDAPTVQYNA